LLRCDWTEAWRRGVLPGRARPHVSDGPPPGGGPEGVPAAPPPYRPGWELAARRPGPLVAPSLMPSSRVAQEGPGGLGAVPSGTSTSYCGATWTCCALRSVPGPPPPLLPLSPACPEKAPRPHTTYSTRIASPVACGHVQECEANRIRVRRMMDAFGEGACCTPPPRSSTCGRPAPRRASPRARTWSTPGPRTRGAGRPSPGTWQASAGCWSADAAPRYCPRMPGGRWAAPQPSSAWSPPSGRPGPCRQAQTPCRSLSSSGSVDADPRNPRSVPFAVVCLARLRAMSRATEGILANSQ